MPNSALNKMTLSPRIFVSIFSAGSELNTDYSIPVPSEIEEMGHMIVGLMVSNNPNGADVPMESFYDINYIGVLKTNGIYQIKNVACLNNTARAIWACW